PVKRPLRACQPRDILLQVGTPVIFLDPVYLVIAFVAAGIGFFFAGLISRLAGVIVVLDGLALGFMCTAGATAALAANLAPSSVVFIASITALGGLILRDIMSGDAPKLVRPGNFIAIPAIVASTVFVVLLEMHINWTVAQIAAMAVALSLRAGAYWLGWRTSAAADLSDRVWDIWNRNKPGHANAPSEDTTATTASTVDVTGGEADGDTGDEVI
ncbi:MAG: TRIC cation channel family protein, partial [Actinomycetes bacterium]